MRATTGFFLPAQTDLRGQRFCLYHPASSDPVRGCVVYVHPFAEEMNKSRRMAALQSRTLAAAGFCVLQIDLCGCGDSGGDLGDTTWEEWIADVVTAVRWLREQTDAPLWLWGLRAGALVASAAAHRIDETVHQLWWQPPGLGRTIAQQFTRLKVAEALADGAKHKEVAQQLRARLDRGETVEIAGYEVSASLLLGLEKAVLVEPRSGSTTLWIEVSPREGSALLPASERQIADWRRQGHRIADAVVAGPQFWLTTEIEDAPALIETTTAMLSEMAS